MSAYLPERVEPHGVLRIDPGARRAWAGETELELGSREFEVLQLLDGRRNHVVPREELVEAVWGAAWDEASKAPDMAIGRLRRKLEDAGAGDRIVAVRGVGFRLGVR